MISFFHIFPLPVDEHVHSYVHVDLVVSTVNGKQKDFFRALGVKGVRACCNLRIFRGSGGMISFLHIFPLPVDVHVHVFPQSTESKKIFFRALGVKACYLLYIFVVLVA